MIKKTIWIIMILVLNAIAGPAFCAPDTNKELNLAVKSNNIQKVRECISKGADVNLTKEVNGWTPLMWAASFGHIEIANLLIDAGANLNAVSTSGSVNTSGNENALMVAAFKGNTEIAKLLIEKGADINAKNSEGWTPLVWAAAFNHPEIVRLLIEKGANVETKSSDGITVLWRAASFGHIETVRLLLEKGANINAVDFTGNTVLDAALLKNRRETAELLKNAGASSTLRSIPKPKKQY